MGIFQSLFGGAKKEAPHKAVPYDPELARRMAGEVVEEMTEPVVRFTLERGEAGIFESKVGGTPYLPRDMAWPVDSRGVGMELLAQVDCAALAGLPDFPHTGLLQFFTALDDVYGIDFDDQVAQTGFRVLYHDTVDPRVTQEEVLAKKAPQPVEDREYDTPLLAKARMVFSAPETQHISEADYQAWGEFLRRWNEVHPGAGLKNAWEFYHSLPEDESWEIFPETEDKGPHHQLGGYPYFTQEDPRGGREPAYTDLNVLLFQLDSDMHTRDKGGDLVMWGDCGVANFFISREALKRRDFSRVCYNWDCC